MRSRYERKLEEGARPLLEEGEDVLAAFVARPRGWTQATAGAIHVGAEQQGRAHAAAAQAQFPLPSPMALALTQRRLLSIAIGSPLGLGLGGRVKELVGSAPLADVDSIAVKRLPLGQVVTATVRGSPIRLEANALAGARRLAEEFARAKASLDDDTRTG